ncbi:acyltransferase [Williamsia sp. CHRR-6]|uniref:acyltransferase n=1 Tax=Williamsia sp. CHRR-6 TaxID=2835871 RepID=UPI001BDA906B|nr:acyltransferase [Williamsia sp. CHRR-6]MBT0566253.1 acyltransferase [Williamsia sp. CHRR-6]
MTAALTTAPILTTTTRTRRAHLHQLDFVRGSTFLMVILLHTLTNTNDEQTSVLTNGLGMWGHFTRNAFFFLTGFVLMFGTYDKPDFSVRSFYARRLKLVVIPYLVWSVAYWAYAVIAADGPSALPYSLHSLSESLTWGTAGFHLYFIFVIVQFYLLFPLIRILLRATRNHHMALVAVSLAVQLVTLYVFTQTTPPAGTWLATNWWHAYATFLPYQFFVIAGAVAAVHRDRFDAMIRGRGGLIVAGLILAGAFAVGAFIYEINSGTKPIDASSALNPCLQPLIIMLIVSIYAAALWWSDRRERTPRFNAVVDYASNRSFAIFLSHVLVLQLLVLPRGTGPAHGWFQQHLGAPWATLVVYLLTVIGTLGLAELLRRSPGALYLTGRPRVRRC